jgi:AmmeMemoRadiSam system protein B
MKRKKLLFLLFFLSLLGIVFIIAFKYNIFNKNETKNTFTPSDVSNQSIHPLNYFQIDLFYEGVNRSETENKYFKHHIAGGIIPHHLLVSYIITDFFHSLSKQNPKTIIIIGPNHYEKGDYKVLSSLYGWETPFGVVEPNEKIIQELVEKKLVKIDEINFPNDYSVSGIIPFVKYYLPDTKVVPLLLSENMNEEDIRALSNSLSKYLNKDTIIVAAVDFSHYLTSLQAQEKNKVTLEAMQNFDYKQIISFKSDYLDSSSSIVTLLMTMKTLGTTEMDLLYNTDSGMANKSSTDKVTSYFSIAFY